MTINSPPERRVRPHLCFPLKPACFSEHIHGRVFPSLKEVFEICFSEYVNYLSIIAEAGPDDLVFGPFLLDPEDFPLRDVDNVPLWDLPVLGSVASTGTGTIDRQSSLGRNAEQFLFSHIALSSPSPSTSNNPISPGCPGKGNCC